VLNRAVVVALVDDQRADVVQRAAVAAGRLVHDAIAAVYDTGRDERGAWVVVEHVSGPSIADRLAREGPLPVTTAVRLAARIFAALAHAHAHGVRHGQLDATTVGGAIGGEKITGFGLAELAGSEADDIAAAAVLTARMVTGVPPPRDRGPGWLRRARPGVPAQLEGILEHALVATDGAEALATDLLALDLGPDDAVPLVAHDDTPPSGVRTVPRPAARRGGIPILVSLLTLLAAVVTLAALRSGAGNGSGTVPIAIASVTPFDPPPGDGRENGSDAQAAIDGDPTTAWATEAYSTATLGNLKPGVGLIVALADTAALHELTIDTPTTDWRAEIYAGTGTETTLAEWGSPVTTTETSTTALSTTTPALLLWFTHLGPTADSRYAMQIAELTLT
jgi:hypothetical protein